MAEVKKSASKKAEKKPAKKELVVKKKKYYLPAFRRTIEASSITEAIEIAKKKGNK